jgi:hypothetical protein
MQGGDEATFRVDVVAVHGLGGDFYNTWTFEQGGNQKQKPFWLSDFLPTDLPGARVFTFGYPSKFGSSKSVAEVRDYARMLLQSLQRIAVSVCWICSRQKDGAYNFRERCNAQLYSSAIVLVAWL